MTLSVLFVGLESRHPSGKDSKRHWLHYPQTARTANDISQIQPVERALDHFNVQCLLARVLRRFERDIPSF